MERHGWHLFRFKLFAQRLNELERDVTDLAAKDPQGYKQHPKAKLLASVYKSIMETVPTDPAAPIFRLGHTLGKGNVHWRRVKKGLPQRYRLFFMFSSVPLRAVVYVWGSAR